MPQGPQWEPITLPGRVAIQAAPPTLALLSQPRALLWGAQGQVHLLRQVPVSPALHRLPESLQPPASELVLGTGSAVALPPGT